MVLQKALKIGKATFLVSLLVILLALFQPDWLIAVLANGSPEVVYFVETEEPVVALTIDDGPDAAATPKILDILERYGAHATFFLISNRVRGNEKIVRQAITEDHEIANHMAMDQPSIGLNAVEFERQLLQAHRVLSKFADIHWFRPGSGWYNAEILATAKKHGYQTALGSIYPYDAHIPSTWFVVGHILWQVQPGSVIILHDHGSRGQRTAAVLAAILPVLKRRGFRVVTLSELLDSKASLVCQQPHTHC
jgi:peptidoglycan/xylan/chitin deacetylase (PgdA/CDA1 family)